MNCVKTSIARTIVVPFTHRVYFTRSTFSRHNRLLAELISRPLSATPPKVMAVIDRSVAASFPDLVEEVIAYFSEESSLGRLVRSPLLALGGETAKGNRNLVEELYQQIEQHGICRHSYLVAIGGGALLDTVGFAAATAHRGVRHIRLPTTTLSQADGGVGVKNGINAFGKKNFIGTFTPPFAIINDSDFLTSLPEQHKRDGLIEAIKVALIQEASFFYEIEHAANDLSRFDPATLERVIFRCAELHIRHIAESGDPFEFGSARPLDFGHWSAHKLEQMSDFRMSHGSAVACGIALDALYSHKKQMLSENDVERVLALIQKLGFAIYNPLMRQIDVDGNLVLLGGLEEFREHLGGELTITLLSKIGCGIEVHEIDFNVMHRCITELAQHYRP